MYFESFDSLDEAFAAMARGEAAANARLHERQRAMIPPCWFVRVVDLGPDRVVIFGEVPAFERLRAMEIALGGSQEEADSTDAMLRAAGERGYLFGQCFSVVEADGEWGSTHKAEVWPITQAQFEEAREFQWNPQAIADAFGPAHWLFNLGPEDER